MKKAFLVATLFATAVTTFALASFPGAQGWGGEATGGRGGAVIHVINLNNSGAGSFRDACGTSGAKTIVFDVSGVINLGESPIFVNSNTTIAGQTSPGGITLTNGGLYGHGVTNVIIRHIRVRDAAEASDGDCFRMGMGCTNFILDHCSGMWCSDEIIDLQGSHTGTVQNTIIAEPGACQNRYGSDIGNGNDKTGILASACDGRITFYRCVLSQIFKRGPMLTNDGATDSAGKTFEFINNVTYNTRGGGDETFSSNNNIPLNLLGNYYKGGVDASYSLQATYPHANQQPITMFVRSSMNYNVSLPTLTNQKAYFNLYNPTSPNYLTAIRQPLKTTLAEIDSGRLVFSKVMASTGPFPRDSADRRVIKDIQNGTGKMLPYDTCRPVVMDPFITTGPTKPTDSDNDGMPNSWESAHGLNPNLASDQATIQASGYSALEEYINTLADSVVTVAAEVDPASDITSQNGLEVASSPEPFNPEVCFTLKGFTMAPVRMEIYTSTAKRIYSEKLVSSFRATWNGHSQNGKSANTGIYLVRFSQGNKTITHRVSLIR